jgi:hypothetical protein
MLQISAQLRRAVDVAELDVIGDTVIFGRGIKRIIIDDIKKLSFSQQKKLHDYARAMLVPRPVGTRGSDLMKFSGMFDKKTVNEMKGAIREGCERVDRTAKGQAYSRKRYVDSGHCQTI